MHNIVFIDGQNLHLGTKQDNWSINHLKLITYLKENYSVFHAYYFIGYKSDKFEKLYTSLKSAGFTIIFKEHSTELFSSKKGNVDTDIVFEIMKHLIDYPNFKKIILVSGDGDYKKLVDYLIFKNKFLKILFPNKKFVSALYKGLSLEYFDYMEHIKKYIEYKNDN